MFKWKILKVFWGFEGFFGSSEKFWLFGVFFQMMNFSGNVRLKVFGFFGFFWVFWEFYGGFMGFFWFFLGF